MEDLKRLIFPAILALLLHGFLVSLKLPRQAALKPVLTGNPIKIEINAVSSRRAVPVKRVEVKKITNVSKPVPPRNIAQKKIPKQPIVEKEEKKIFREKNKDILQNRQLKKPIKAEILRSPEKITDKAAAAPAEKAERMATEISENDPKKDLRKEETSTAPINTKAIPKYRKNRQPPYPLIAKRRGYEGEILLSVLVDGSGMVSEITIKNSSGHLSLDSAALTTVKNWLFTPATVNGRPVAMWVDVPILFQLK